MSITSKVASITVAPIPVGSLQAYAGIDAPIGWLVCDGSQVSRTLFPELFNVIGTTYGSGDGSSTFTLPDLRGRTIAGRDGVNNMNNGPTNRLTSTYFGASGTALGNSGGNEAHTLTTAQLAAHNHGVTDPGHVHQYGVYGGSFGDGSGAASLFTGFPLRETRSTGNNATNISIQNNGSGNAHNNTQPTIILNYIIKAVSELPRGGWYRSDSVPVVTALPTNPYSGQEIYYQQTVASTVYQTHKRYDSSTSTWKDVGATPTSSWTSVSSFSNSWANYGGAWQTARYMKDANGTVFIEGLIASGTLGTSAFTLPAGYRPTATLIFPTLSNQTIGRLDIDSSGNVVPSLGSNAFASITCSFKASA